MPAAVAIPSLVSLGTSLVGGALGSSASKKAAEQQGQASAAAQQQIGNAVTGAQTGMGNAVGIANDQIKEGVQGGNTTLANVWQQQQGVLNPYLNAGAQGATDLASLFKNGGEQFAFNPADLQNTPGYKFQMDQGTEAIKRQAAAGASSGGGTLASLLRFGQGLANTTYDQAYNRALNTFQTNRTNSMNGLMALAGLGQNATGQFNSAAMNFGNNTNSNLVNSGMATAGNTVQGAQYGGNVGIQGAMSIADLIAGAGNARAAGTVGSGNAWSGALSNIGNTVAGAYQTKSLADMFGGGGKAAGTQAYSGPSAAEYASKLWTTPMAAPPALSAASYQMPTWMQPKAGGL